MSSTRLRAKTVVLARAAYNVMGIINAIIMPKFLNVEALNWGAKTGCESCIFVDCGVVRI